MKFSELLNELNKLDKKYIMIASHYTSGKLECYTITTRKSYRGIYEKLHAPIERDVLFHSLEEGLKHAGENCNRIVFSSLDHADSIIISKVYKKFGGYVNL